MARSAKSFVSHTSGTQTVDGAKGVNNRLDRCGEVAANRVTETGSQKATVRIGGDTTGSDGGGDKGAGVSVRSTHEDQHGLSGKVEPAHVQP